MQRLLDALAEVSLKQILIAVDIGLLLESLTACVGLRRVLHTNFTWDEPMNVCNKKEKQSSMNDVVFAVR